ncbi:MAG: hypothetical protein ACRBB4_01365 [Neptuniibacter sp.]
MTQTVVFEDIGNDPVVLADGATYSTVTVQVRGVEDVEIVVDDRDEATRQAAGDNIGVSYTEGEKTQFSGFVGEIRVNRLSKVSKNTARVVVVRS